MNNTTIEEEVNHNHIMPEPVVNKPLPGLLVSVDTITTEKGHTTVVMNY